MTMMMMMMMNIEGGIEWYVDMTMMTMMVMMLMMT
jgi:hypothetical protein